MVSECGTVLLVAVTTAVRSVVQLGWGGDLRPEQVRLGPGVRSTWRQGRRRGYALPVEIQLAIMSAGGSESSLSSFDNAEPAN